MAMSREMKNDIKITGVAVKVDIKEFETKKGKDAIGGTIVIRTSDGSENEVNVYSDKWKIDSEGNETNETKYFFNEYEKFKDEVVTLETDKENASVVEVSQVTFGANDFKGKDGNVVSNNRLNAKFVKILSDKDIETTQQVAKFEVEGIVEKIEDVLDKEQAPTGKGIVKLNHITSTKDFKDKNAKPEPTSMFPITLTIPKDLYSAFQSAGYFEGCFVKFVGNLKNTVTIDKVVEKQSFGEDIVKEVKHTVKEYEVRSGNTATTFDTIGLTQDNISMLIAKRKQHLEEVKKGNTESDGTFGNNSTSSTSTPKSAPSNPFSSTSVNPFA